VKADLKADFSFDPVTHTYFYGGKVIPGVTAILDSHGLISEFAKRDQNARTRGHYVHKAMALFGKGILDWSELDPRILGYVLSGVLFYKEWKFQPYEDALESPWYHPDYLYGYTMDALGFSVKLQEHLLPDFKTGKAPKLATKLQLAGYKEGAKRKYGGKFRTMAVELDPYGGMPNIVPLGNERTDWSDFLSCLNVYRLKEA